MSLLETKPPETTPEQSPTPEQPESQRAVACKACGAALEPEQPVCLECGTVVRRRRLRPSGWPLRAGLASLAALIVSAVAGLGVAAALQSGGEMPKTVSVTKQAPPVSTFSKTPTLPPPATPATPASPAAPGAPAAKAATPTPSSKTPAPTSGGGTPTPSPQAGGSPGATPAPSSPAHPSGGTVKNPFPNGVTPVSVNLLDPNDKADNPDTLFNAYDGDGNTVWKSAAGANRQLGITLDAGGNQLYPSIGIMPGKWKGYSVQIYGSAASTAPTTTPSQGGWTSLTQQPSTISKRTVIKLSPPPKFQPRYYLVWISVPGNVQGASVAEVAFLTG